MKNKFKVGDKVKAKVDYTDVTKGKIYSITRIEGSHITIIDDVSEHTFYGSLLDFFIPFNNPTLTIKKLTRTRAGKEYHTFQFSVKGKIVNHQFDTEQSRDKSLTRFIKYIQDGDFKIVKG